MLVHFGTQFDSVIPFLINGRNNSNINFIRSKYNNMEYNTIRELLIVHDSTHFYLSSKQPFGYNPWLLKARVIIDGRHIYI